MVAIPKITMRNGARFPPYSHDSGSDIRTRATDAVIAPVSAKYHFFIRKAYTPPTIANTPAINTSTAPKKKVSALAAPRGKFTIVYPLIIMLEAPLSISIIPAATGIHDLFISHLHAPTATSISRFYHAGKQIMVLFT